MRSDFLIRFSIDARAAAAAVAKLVAALDRALAQRRAEEAALARWEDDGGRGD